MSNLIRNCFVGLCLLGVQNLWAGEENPLVVLLPNLRSDSGCERAQAAKALGQLGKVGKAAVPDLTKSLQDPEKEVRYASALALLELGVEHKDPMAVLATALRERDLNSSALYHDLTELSPRSKSATSLLIDILKDRNLQNMHCFAAGALPASAAEATPELIRMLTSPKFNDRTSAALALHTIGPPAREAIPALQAALKDPKKLVVLWSAMALRKIQPDNREAVQIVVEMANDADTDGRAVAICVMRDWGPLASPCIADLCKILANSREPSRLRWLAAVAIGNTGAPASPLTIRSLKEALDAKEEEVRVSAAGALSKLDPKQNSFVIPVLVAALQTDPGWSKTAELLGAMGPTAKSAIPALRAAVKKKSPSVATAAALALFKIEPSNPDGLPALIAMLNQESEHDLASGLAIEALGQIGPRARPAVPHLVSLLDKGDKGRLAAKAIRQILGEP